MKPLVCALLFTVFTASLSAQETTTAEQVEAPPAPSAPREAKLPEPVEKRLANGLRVIVVPKHDTPLVAARLMIRTGAAADPRDRTGVAALTAQVLTKGTRTRSAEEIARGIEALGATLEADAGWDMSGVDVSVMSSNMPKAMEYVADVVRNATFPQAELTRERSQAIDALQVSLRQPRTLANVVASRLIFGEAPYGRSREGTPETLAKIRRADLVSFHDIHYRPRNAVLVLAGDIKADAAFQLAQSAFGDWKAGTIEVAPARAAMNEGGRRVVVIDMPEAGQAAVVAGRYGIRRSDPAYVRALVANSILGGGYSSRLNQEIRIRRGLSYGAGSSFDPRADVGPFTARTETKHESVPEVVGLITGEMTRLSGTAVPETELIPRKASLVGTFAQSLETTTGIVNRVSSLALYDLSLDEINRYVSSVQAVTAEDVQKFAAANLAGEPHIVIVGDASRFIEPLRKQYEDVEVIAVSELDLNSPALRVRKKKE